MNNIFRFWNQNRFNIIIGVVVIVFIIIVIQVINGIMRQNRLNNANQNRVVLTEEEKNLPTKSRIGQGNTSVETAKENVSTIEEFVEKCNNKDVSGAYEMLTDDCKEILFSTEEKFKSGYYDRIFSEKRICDMENFLTDNGRHTYLVKFYENVLSSGKSEGAKAFQDYITIDQDGKLNLNSLIYKREVNKEQEVNGIKVIVTSQEVYKDNEKINIRVENDTYNRISINAKRASKGVYAIGRNNITYGSNISEIASTLYEIPSKFYRDYKLTFNKLYSSSIRTDYIVFSSIATDYEQYKEGTNIQTIQITVTI